MLSIGTWYRWTRVRISSVKPLQCRLVISDYCRWPDRNSNRPTSNPTNSNNIIASIHVQIGKNAVRTVLRSRNFHFYNENFFLINMNYLHFAYVFHYTFFFHKSKFIRMKISVNLHYLAFSFTPYHLLFFFNFLSLQIYTQIRFQATCTLWLFVFHSLK